MGEEHTRSRPEPRPAAGGAIADGRDLDGLERRQLFGLEFVDAPDLTSVVDSLVADRPGQPTVASSQVINAVVTPNVDILVALAREPSSVAAVVFRRAQYVLPDGQPIVAASRLLGKPLGARLPGSGLFAELWPRLVADDRAVAVLCANEGIANRLEAQHPRAVALVAPMIDIDSVEQVSVVAKELYEAAIDIDASFVFVGLGHPKDAVIIAALQRLWREAGPPAPLSLGLGGSFAMYIGQKRRAPRWMQRIGMEWFYRFMQEPRRLFRRYFIDDFAFFGIVFREWRMGGDE